jgi:hypothetical protein
MHCSEADLIGQPEPEALHSCSCAEGHFILTLQLLDIVFIGQVQEAHQIQLLLHIVVVEVEEEIFEGLQLHLLEVNPPGSSLQHFCCQHCSER